MNRKYATDFSDRHLYLGASEVAQALNVSKWKNKGSTSRVLMEEKLGLAKRETEPVMERGRFMEPAIMQIMREQHGLEIVDEQREFITPVRLWQVSHVDGILPTYTPAPQDVDQPLLAEGPGVLEGKALGARVARLYRDKGLPNDYIIQLHLNCLNAGTTWGRFSILDYDPWDVIMFDVVRDDDLLAKVLPAATQWWKDKEAGQLPQDDEPMIDIPESKGTALSLPEEDTELDAVIRLVRSLVAIKKVENQAKAEKKTRFDALTKYADQHGYTSFKLAEGGSASVGWKKGSQGIDGKKLWPVAETLCNLVAEGNHEEALSIAGQILKNPETYHTFRKASRNTRVNVPKEKADA